MASVTQGAKGAVKINADNSVTYTPGNRFAGSDSFTYAASDGKATATATVAVTAQKSGGGKPKLTAQR